MMRLGARRIIVAIDTNDLAVAIWWAQMLAGLVYGIKLGLEFINAHGPRGVEEVQEAAGPTRLFFDGKFSDIPNTVAGAVCAVSPLRPWMLNVHAMAGRTAMKAAVDAARKYATDNQCQRTLVIAVTVLTSLDHNALEEMGMLPSLISRADIELGLEAMGLSREDEPDEPQRSLKESGDKAVRAFVVQLAKLAQEAGLDGVVASPLEVEAIRAACGPSFLIVTPGVRPAGSATNDQARLATPAVAVGFGADYVVIGRPITEAKDPKAAIEAIATEIEAVLPAA